MYKQKRFAPIKLCHLQAKRFLDAPNRAIKYSPLMNFSQIMNGTRVSTIDDETLGLLRCATLIVEAALPLGAVETGSEGSWKPEYSAYWRTMVMNATTPGDLMGCIVVLESVLSKDWIRPNAEHLLSCLPRPWMAINEATASSVALRLWVLDRGIKYELTHDDEDDEWQDIEDSETEDDDDEDSYI